MGILPDSTLLHNFRVESLVSYLELTGWRSAKGTGERWLVFEGASDIDGELLEIVLPCDPSVRDLKIYVASAINVLCAVTENTPEEMVRKIKFHDRDVLSIRNLETGEQDSITLKLADQQVSWLKRLFAFSASSEQDVRPHFDVPLSIADRVIERYRFGHTFPGSFGYTIESPVIGEPDVWEQSSSFPELVEKVVILPLERRVMERVVRGLLATQQATAEGDLPKLVREYERGFNANMCDAVVGMSAGKTLPLEYSVLWSPRLKPSDDIETPGVIRLHEVSYQYLEDAARELQKLKPEYAVIRGRVTDLSSRADPHGAIDVRRSVAIWWTDRPDGGSPTRVIVSLEKEDYVAAIEAHEKWRTVQVTGIIQKVGNRWRLSDPRDFKVVW